MSEASSQQSRGLLFVVGSGIGNQIMAIPAFWYCLNKYPFVDVYNAVPTWPKATQFLFGRDARVVEAKHLNPLDYGGQYLTLLTQKFAVPDIPIVSKNVTALTGKSEVELNLMAADDAYSDRDVAETKDILGWVEPANGVPEVLLHDGYNKMESEDWEYKSYPHYKELAKMLKDIGYSVGSIGIKGEYIPGTKDMTGQSLEDTAKIIRGSNLLITNDTGTYHLANLLETKCISLFTFTDPTKGYDPRFHKTTTVLRRDDVECSPCHKNAFQKEKDWVDCSDRQCREIPVKEVVSACRRLTSDNRKLTNSAIAVITGRNCSDWLKKCLDTVLSQDYEDLGILLLDDASTDDSAEVAAEMLEDHGDSVVLVNKERQPKSKTYHEAITSKCANPDSVIFLIDGDDYLLGDTAISEMMAVHDKFDVVWSQNIWSKYGRGMSQPINWNMDRSTHAFIMQHLKSFKNWMFRRIKADDLKDWKGRWLGSAIDQAIMWPLVEMAGPGGCKFLDRVLYHYRDHSGCMHNSIKKDQKNSEDFIRQGKPYPLVGKAIKVSVVIPCYNCAEYLDRSIGSVIWQKMPDWEIIVVDDGSTDNCSEIVEKYQKTFPKRITLIQQKNKGPAAARNAGVAVARGDWILPLDADNGLPPDHLIKTLQASKDHDVVYTDLQMATGGLRVFNLSIEKMKNASAVDNCSLIRKTLWDKVGGQDESMCCLEDWELWVKCIEAKARFIKCKDTWVGYDDTREGRRSEVVKDKFYEIKDYMTSKYPDFFKQDIEVKAEEVPVSHQGGLTVIVSSYNQQRELELALESYYFQNMLPSEVIVADDGSSDGTIEWLDMCFDRYPFPVRYVTREHGAYGLASINNMASKHAQGERILFTNADVLHSPMSFGAHMGLPGNAVGGGIVLGISQEGAKNITKDMIVGFGRIERMREEYPSTKTNEEFVGKTDPKSQCLGAWGGNVSVPRDIFVDVMYDEDFDGCWGGEDAEMVKRMMKSGASFDWAMASQIYHLDHPRRTYSKQAKGRRKVSLK